MLDQPMKLLFAIATITFSCSSAACFIAPAEQLVDAPELLAKSKDVTLAQVVRAETTDRGEVRYFFKVQRRFSGDDRTSFELLGYPAIWEGNNRTFSHHFEPTFWERNQGRNSNGTDCKIRPNFSVGGTYLIFLGQAYTRKSFELIIRTHGDEATRDKWLQYVERHFEAAIGSNDSSLRN
jgi:hypothetical protein